MSGESWRMTEEKMKFKSTQIKGKGRGKLLGFPTINLRIPPNFSLNEGIYASKVKIEHKNYSGALHYGPIPVFSDPKKSLEVFLIDVKSLPESSPRHPGELVTPGSVVSIETLKKIRDIRNFESPNDLLNQIAKDIEEIKKL